MAVNGKPLDYSTDAIFEALAILLDDDRQTALLSEIGEKIDAYRDLVADGIQAFRLTREYVGQATLPALAGWSWFDWTERAKGALVGDEVDHRAEIAALRKALDDLLADQGCEEDGTYVLASARAAEALLDPPIEDADLDAATRAYFEELP